MEQIGFNHSNYEERNKLLNYSKKYIDKELLFLCDF